MSPTVARIVIGSKVALTIGFSEFVNRLPNKADDRHDVLSAMAEVLGAQLAVASGTALTFYPGKPLDVLIGIVAREAEIRANALIAATFPMAKP